MDSNNISLADIAAVTDRSSCGYGYGGGMYGMEFLLTLLILPMMWGGGFGGWGNRNCGGNPVTEAGLCEAMNSNNLQNAVGRLSDVTQQGISTLGYESLNQTNALQRDLCTGLTGVVAAVNDAARQQADCCCTTNRNIDQLRYDGAMNTAAVNATTTATGQKVLDAICGLRMEMKDDRIGQMQNQINQLQLNAALCGVVRYPNQTAFFAQNPFFGCGCNTGCCNGNI